MHEEIDVNEASRRLVNITASKPKYGPWTLVLVYGLASVFVGPFAFQARLVDLPVAFLLGSLLGFLQHIVAPRSILYANVMEVFAAVLTSFLARAFGSLRDGKLFCFSALAQSSITMILPGYFVRKTIPPFSISFLLLKLLYSPRSPRAPIPQYGRRLHPHGLRYHIVTLPRFWYNDRNGIVRRSRSECYFRSHLPEPSGSTLEFSRRSTFHTMYHSHISRYMEAVSHHARHCVRWLRRELLLGRSICIKCSDR